MKTVSLLILAALAVGSPAVAQQAPAAGAAPTGAARPPLIPEEAPPTTSCRHVRMLPDTQERASANVNVSTRLKFPGQVKTYEMSTPGLWDVGMKGDSVWIRPRIIDPAAAKTGLTVFLDNGRQYDFIVSQADELRDPSCIIVQDPPPSAQTKGERQAREEAEQAERTIAQLNARLDAEEKRQQALIRRMRSQVEQQATDRIKSFQQSINTKYSWKGGDDSADDQRLIDSVYDDGRFTYVRITTTAFGLPAIVGQLNNHDIVLQYTYEDLTGVFTILGLFDHLQVKLGTHAVDVVRQG